MSIFLQYMPSLLFSQFFLNLSDHFWKESSLWSKYLQTQKVWRLFFQLWLLLSNTLLFKELIMYFSGAVVLMAHLPPIRKNSFCILLFRECQAPQYWNGEFETNRVKRTSTVCIVCVLHLHCLYIVFFPLVLAICFCTLT